MRFDLATICTNTYFLSSAKRADYLKGREYLALKMGYPDEGSEFDVKLGPLKYAFRVPVLRDALTAFLRPSMIDKGYDILLLALDE